MTPPKISIIIPVYNVEKYLDRCMDSILGQTMTEMEIILVDDGSPGRCPQMCDGYAARDSRVKVIHQLNAGAGLARNAGIQVASGEYVAFIDSDDYVALDMMERMYALASERHLDAVSCGITNLNPDGSVRSKECAYPEYHETGSTEELWQIASDTLSGKCLLSSQQVYHRHRPAVWRFLFRMEVIRKYGIVFPSEREVFSEDCVFNLRFLTHASKIGYIPHFLVYHCYNTDSLTSTRKKLKEYRLYRKEFELCSEMGQNSTFGEYLRRAAVCFYLDSIHTMFQRLMRSDLCRSEKMERILTVVNDASVWCVINRDLRKSSLPIKRRLLCWLGSRGCCRLLYLLYCFF